MSKENNDELEEHEFMDEDGIINTDIRILKSTGNGVNLNVSSKKSKQEKELKKTTGPSIKRIS